MATDRRQFTMRFEDELVLMRVREVAKRERRSVAAEIELVLIAFLKEYEKENGFIHVDAPPRDS